MIGFIILNVLIRMQNNYIILDMVAAEGRIAMQMIIVNNNIKIYIRYYIYLSKYNIILFYKYIMILNNSRIKNINT